MPDVAEQPLLSSEATSDAAPRREAPAIARVEPLTTARALRGPFDYRLGPSWEGAGVGVGTVLRVPFGRRRLLGVVTAMAATSELAPERLAEPIETVGDGVPEELVELGLWVGEEYCSTPARGLSLVLAPGTGTAGERLRARRELRVRSTATGREALEREDVRLGSRQRAVLEALVAFGGDGDEPELTATELASRTGADRSTLGRLEGRGLIATRSATAAIVPRAGREVPPATAPGLSRDQAAAVARIGAALGETAGDPERVLLHGVTGSGKTEVYLAAAEAALACGRGAIVLVPEIGLTPQAVNRFRSRLGDGIAVLHSALTGRERFDEWTRLRRGEARVCIGPRSAVFAPIADPGLVVIDEEHDSSYKQERDPRYDAREVAARRMRGRGGALLAGTATPRPETWIAAERISMPSRVDGRSLPPVQLVDMRGAGARSGPLHERTLTAIDGSLGRGQKAIVLINRRGFAPWLTCRSCGRHWGCPNCDVSLITHQGAGRLVCHHCAHSEPSPESCLDCGSVTLARSGAGTERVEEALAEHFAPAPVIRLDADSVSGASGHSRVLDRFAAAGPAILVGTQMVAKGHDFPDVTTSAVIDADATLRFPDFRAEERTFALVTQLAGRSGRGEDGGEVVVQTLAPGAPSIDHAARHDAPGFLTAELERRRALDYPPYSHLVRIGLEAVDERRLDRVAGEVRAALEPVLPDRASLLGPAPMFRARGRHRRRLLIKTSERASAVAAIRQALEALAGAGALRETVLSVDVDPQ